MFPPFEFESVMSHSIPTLLTIPPGSPGVNKNFVHKYPETREISWRMPGGRALRNGTFQVTLYTKALNIVKCPEGRGNIDSQGAQMPGNFMCKCPQLSGEDDQGRNLMRYNIFLAKCLSLKSNVL